MIKHGKPGLDQQTSVATIELPVPPVFSANRENLNLKGSKQDRVLAGYIAALDALPGASAFVVCSILIDMAKISLTVAIAAASNIARKDPDPDRTIGALNALRHFDPGEAIKVTLERLLEPTLAAQAGRVLFDIDPVLALIEFKKLAGSDNDALCTTGKQLTELFA